MTAQGVWEQAACHVCGARRLGLVEGFESLPRVTSDCRPWPAGGSLGVCKACGAVVKPVTDRWIRETEQIYAGYAVYELAGGAEQRVFDPEVGRSVPRSQVLLDRLRETVALPRTGRWLDFGCGNGGLLRTVSDILPAWELEGVEKDARYRDVVEEIPGVGALRSSLDECSRRFQVISLVHVLEHLDRPEALLKSLVELLDPGGVLLVQVPNHRENPFDLLIADHCTHFAVPTLARVLAGAGLKVIALSNTWVAKEWTAVARPGPSAEWAGPDPGEVRRALEKGVGWLRRTLAWAERETDRPNVGLFGTAIAGTWLASALAERVSFFVDEDPNRGGRRYNGLPVLSPDQVVAGATVLVAVAPVVAEGVCRRLGEGSVRYLAPPVL